MKNGEYELVRAPLGYPGTVYRGKYVYEHHLVWWQNTNELVPAGYVVHHKNGKKRDNRFSNLELQSRELHVSEHQNARTIRVKVLCGWCRKPFFLNKGKFTERMKHSKSGELFCCRSHQATYQFHKV